MLKELVKLLKQKRKEQLNGLTIQRALAVLFEYVSVIGLLSLIIIGQQVSIHRLINKVMSHNYHDYQFTKKEVGKESPPKGIQVDQEPAEDFNVLSEITSNII
jgi:hypothetical protein